MTEKSDDDLLSEFLPDKDFLVATGLWDKILSCKLCGEKMFFIYESHEGAEPLRDTCYECTQEHVNE